MTTMTMPTTSSNSFSAVLEKRDLLGHTLSYLQLADLARTGAVCKHLNDFIFGPKTNTENGGEVMKKSTNNNNDTAWFGAEKGLTGIGGKEERLDTITNAQEHCRLFYKAAKFAQMCEEANRNDTVPQIGVDLPLKMMNIKGVTQESVEAAAQAAANRTDLELMQQLVDRQAEKEAKEENQEVEEVEPPKEYNHLIFLRVSRRVASGDQEQEILIGQGFVHGLQTTSWARPLDQQRMSIVHLERAGLSNTPEYKSLINSSRFDKELGHFRFDQNIDGFLKSIQFTAVVVFKNDERVQLLHCSDHGNTPGSRVIPYRKRGGEFVLLYEFPSSSKFRREYFQLDEPAEEQYAVHCNFGIAVQFDPETKQGGFYSYLCFGLEKDPSILRIIMILETQRMLNHGNGRP